MSQESSINPVSSFSGKDAWTVAREVSRSAGELLLEWWPKLKEISDEGDNDIVTNVDKAAEILIRDELARQFPTHGFYGEELKGDQLESGFVWVVDPIDGTRNYAMGIPFFSIVVALAKDGEVVTGVNYDPLRDEMFHAALGCGAFLGEDKIKVSSRESLDGSVIGTDAAYGEDNGTEKTLQMLRRLWPRLSSVRMIGSSALGISYAASGRLDIYVHHSLQPYDQAAGLLLIEEAGGLATDRYGYRAKLNSDGIIATSALLHEDFIKATIKRT